MATEPATPSMDLIRLDTAQDFIDALQKHPQFQEAVLRHLLTRAGQTDQGRFSRTSERISGTPKRVHRATEGVRRTPERVSRILPEDRPEAGKQEWSYQQSTGYRLRKSRHQLRAPPPAHHLGQKAGHPGTHIPNGDGRPGDRQFFHERRLARLQQDGVDYGMVISEFPLLLQNLGRATWTNYNPNCTFTFKPIPIKSSPLSRSWRKS